MSTNNFKRPAASAVQMQTASAFSVAASILAAGAALFAVAAPTHAATSTLTDTNSIVKITTSAPGTTGVVDWSIDGTNELAEEGNWFLIGSTGAGTPVNSLTLVGSPKLTDTDHGGFNNQLTVSYKGKGFDITEVYTLTGPINVSGTQDLSESIHITNTSSSNLQFQLIHYDDFTLDGNTTSLTYNKSTFTQTDDEGSTAKVIGNTKPKKYESGDVPALLKILNKKKLFSLDDHTNTSDNSSALEWYYTIPKCGCESICIDEQLTAGSSVGAVPEPTSVSLLGLASVGILTRRKRRQSW